jgi:hypothetical protein
MHPSNEKILDFVLGTARGRDADSTRRHLEEGCARCDARAARYREVVHALRTDRDPDPPVAWVERVLALGRTEPAPTLSERVARFCGDLVRETARIVTDSLTGPELAPAGLRGAASRRLRFEAGDLELDVALDPAGSGASLTGQLVSLGDDPAAAVGARVLLTGPPEFAAEERTDEGGEFRLDAPSVLPLRLHVVYEDRVSVFEIPAVPEP